MLKGSMACAVAASSNSKRKLRIKERRSPVRRRKALPRCLGWESYRTIHARRLRTLRVGGLDTAPPWARRISKSVCLPFGTLAVLIWRGEKNRGHHQTIQNRAGERSINGGRRRRNDFE